MEPVFAALFGYLFAAEVLPVKGYIGAALVLAGVLVAELKFSRPVAVRSPNKAIKRQIA
ncbi:hypothetical protein D3C71_2071270 [compost metagenome]